MPGGAFSVSFECDGDTGWLEENPEGGAGGVLDGGGGGAFFPPAFDARDC